MNILGFLRHFNIAPPATPPTGLTTVYVDSTSKKLCTKDDTGTVTEYGSGGGGGITNAAGADVIPKSDGTNLVASSITDNGTGTVDIQIMSGSGIYCDVSGGVVQIGDPAGEVGNVFLEVNQSTGRVNITSTSGLYVNNIRMSPPLSWLEVTGTSTLADPDRGYIANNASLVTITLPNAAAVGKTVRVAGKGAGGWRISQNAGGQIHRGSVSTTIGTGGYLASTNRRDAVELVCVVADTEWAVLSQVGTLTVV